MARRQRKLKTRKQHHKNGRGVIGRLFRPTMPAFKWLLGAVGGVAVSVAAWYVTVDRSTVTLSDLLFYDEGAEYTSTGGSVFGGELRISKTQGSPLQKCVFDITAPKSRQSVDI